VRIDAQAPWSISASIAKLEPASARSISDESLADPAAARDVGQRDSQRPICVTAASGGLDHFDNYGDRQKVEDAMIHRVKQRLALWLGEKHFLLRPIA